MKTRQVIPGDELLDDIARIAQEVHRELGAYLSYASYRTAMRMALEEEGYSVDEEFNYEVEFRGETLDSGVVTFRVDESAIVEINADDTTQSVQRGQLGRACSGDDEARGLLLNFDSTHFCADVEGDFHEDFPPYDFRVID